MGQSIHVSKAEQMPEAFDSITIPKLRCAAGFHLEAKKD